MRHTRMPIDSEDSEIMRPGDIHLETVNVRNIIFEIA